MHLVKFSSKPARTPGSIAGADADVLPRLPISAIADVLRRLPDAELNMALRNKLLPIVSMPGLSLFAACSAGAKAAARSFGMRLVAEASPADFHGAVRIAKSAALLNEATYGLARRRPEQSASRRLTGTQAAILLGLASAGLYASATLPGPIVWSVANLLAGLFFLSLIALRLLCLLPQHNHSPAEPPALSDADLPVYSVLVPLFRETAVLRQLLGALGKLSYPAHKLDIKLILEENDTLTRSAVADIVLPQHFEVIVVPAGLPQTKPRALNYALHFARGSLITIYDAEDIPEPRQLRIAAATFAKRPETTGCLQAQLAFYNPNENWLTRQFTIEYATLFGLLLPALASCGLPLPLGGTSNHFRSHILREVGAWDPFNVTEDADLGFRLARAGFRTEAIDSRTYEEANMQLLNWLKQRTRWLKGFLATWLVHMRAPAQLVRELGVSGFWALQACTIGVFISALLHPICTVATAVVLVANADAPEGASLIACGLAGLNIVVLAAGYASAAIAGHKALRQQGITGWMFPLATLPFYWLLMSVAAWMALWQFITAPCYWNKTEHGLSNFQKPSSLSD